MLQFHSIGLTQIVYHNPSPARHKNLRALHRNSIFFAPISIHLTTKHMLMIKNEKPSNKIITYFRFQVIFLTICTLEI